MKNPDTTKLDSEFLKKFRELKKKRNNHLIDEPEFDEEVELLAADTYAHPTEDGWCCACEADIAFLEASVTKREAEAYNKGYDGCLKEHGAVFKGQKMEDTVAYRAGQIAELNAALTGFTTGASTNKEFLEVIQPMLDVMSRRIAELQSDNGEVS